MSRLPSDSTYQWGALLTCLLPAADLSGSGLLSETLRMLLRTPELRWRAPRGPACREERGAQLALGLAGDVDEAAHGGWRSASSPSPTYAGPCRGATPSAAW